MKSLPGNKPSFENEYFKFFLFSFPTNIQKVTIGYLLATQPIKITEKDSIEECVLSIYRIVYCMPSDILAFC